MLTRPQAHVCSLSFRGPCPLVPRPPLQPHAPPSRGCPRRLGPGCGQQEGYPSQPPRPAPSALWKEASQTKTLILGATASAFWRGICTTVPITSRGTLPWCLAQRERVLFSPSDPNPLAGRSVLCGRQQGGAPRAGCVLSAPSVALAPDLCAVQTGTSCAKRVIKCCFSFLSLSKC